MIGNEFATHLTKWVQKNTGHAPKVGVIHANPDQSKHLETATVKVHGRDIDLVNLRAEEYAENSRIPTAMVGVELCARVYCALGFISAWVHRTYGVNCSESARRSRTQCGAISPSTPCSTTSTRALWRTSQDE